LATQSTSGGLHGVALEAVEHGPPPPHDLRRVAVELAGIPLLEPLLGELVVAPQQLDGGQPGAVAQLDGLAAGRVVADPVQGVHRTVDGEVLADGPVLDHRQDQRRGAELEQVRDIAVVRVADDDVEPAVQVGHGVRLVTGVDDRPLQGGLEADLDLEEVAALADLEPGRPGVLADADPPRAGHHLAGDEEGDEVAHDLAERRLAGHQVVLVGAVRGALAVGVVLVEVHPGRDLGEAPHRLAHDQLAGPVPGHGGPR
jgi:hypothetical protein